MKDLIGKEFSAKKSYPFVAKAVQPSDYSPDIRVGERVRIDSCKDGQYKLTNLSLGEPDAWVEVSEAELTAIMGEV